MPAYGGGKAKFGKEISKVIKQYEDKLGWKGPYFEPFCGLLGVGVHFLDGKNGSPKARARARKIIMNDINKDLILMWKALKKGWKPPRTCSKKNYERLKASKKHSKERGFFGVSCAYSGIFFAGYRLKDKTGQNFFKRSRDGLIGMSKYLKNIKFLSKSYTDFKPKGMTIYCDPPYKGNKFNSEHFDDFDHGEFWDTMRRWSRNNLVIISEYSAPKDFKTIWKKETNSTYNSNSKKRVEKLFVLGKTGGRSVLPKKASLGV